MPGPLLVRSSTWEGTLHERREPETCREDERGGEEVVEGSEDDTVIFVVEDLAVLAPSSREVDVLGHRG